MKEASYQKVRHRMILSYEMPAIGQSTDTDARVRWERNGGGPPNGFGVSFRMMKML